ncbi:hypothetical protein NYO67_4726 [Aspergillus flavus]|nr:hypothetical protein NYO67_4726 [Aspergillus flavus]
MATIENSLKDLGPLKNILDFSTPTSGCQLALQGRGPLDLKDQVIATINWQSAQLRRVKQLLKRLAKRGLLQEIFNKEKADHVLENDKEDILFPIAKRLQKTVECLTSSHTKGHVDVFYEDAKSLLTRVLADNKLVSPMSAAVIV